MTDTQLQDFTPILWSQIHGNPFNRNPSAEMLQGKGHVRFVNCWLIGQSRLNPMQIRPVLYDRDYVVQYFAQRVRRLNLALSQWEQLAEEIYAATEDNADSSSSEET